VTLTKYVLIGQTPVPEYDLMTWARWFDDPANRRVAETDVLGMCRVSTIFLGLDHSFQRLILGDGPRILFETMVFWEGEHGYEQERCATWAEAEEQHRRMCTEVVRARAILSWVRRLWSQACEDARDDWRASWRSLQGIQLSGIEALTEQMKLRLRGLDG